MSGIEAIGIAASIIQVAEFGTKLALKLCTFYHQVKESNETVRSLSSDVSLTCTILHQLGDSLEQDAKTKLYSEKAFTTAQEVLGECRLVFNKIDRAVEEQKSHNAKNRVARVTKKFGLALMEGHLDMLRSNLERLKSTVLLMLNVIIYAGQIRCNSESPLLKEQRDLINRLVTEKKANEDKYIQLQETIQSVQVHGHFQALSPSITRDTTSTTSTTYDPSTEINEYYSLFKDLLERVDACKYTLETNRLQRIRNGVMDVHLVEEELFRSVDRQKLSQLVQGDPVLEFRSTQLKKKKANKVQPPLFGPTSSSSQNPFSRQDNAADKPDGQKPQLSLFDQLPAASEPREQKEKPVARFGELSHGSPSQFFPRWRDYIASDKHSEQKESASFSEPATGPSYSPEITSPSSAYTPPSPAPTHEDLSHANTPENHGLLPPQSSGDWESHDRVRSEDDVSDVVDDVLLEWTTIERGELPG